MPRYPSPAAKRPARLAYLAAAVGALLLLALASGALQCSWRQQERHVTSALGALPTSGVQQQPERLAAAVTPPQAAAADTAAGAAAAAAGTPSNNSAAPPAQTAVGSPPFRLPKLIHQTVRDKARLSCQEKKVIESWKRLNPGYTHRLWDDAEMRAFVAEHYPHIVPVPYDLLLSGTERSDIWRVLVLHKYGGVYADMDVQCLRPIDAWNAEHGHDAAVLVGLENYDAKRRPHVLHVNNWAIAAMPGHPMLALLPGVVSRAIATQFFSLAEAQRPLSRKQYELGILDRTGPAALTAALYEFYGSVGFDANAKSQRDVGSRAGVIAGGVRVLPVAALSSGWKVAEARKAGRRYTCDDVGRDDRAALVCHMFWGSWRGTWGHREAFTYEGC